MADRLETTLVSDFLLVEVKGEGWLPFRDVFERDGKPVRDREERLATIFLKGGRDAFEQARADHGRRRALQHRQHQPEHQHAHAAAGIPHRASSPSLRVQAGKRDESDPGVEIEFRETARPTFVATTGGRDLPVRGRFWINEADGTVLRTELDAVDTGVEAHIT